MPQSYGVARRQLPINAVDGGTPRGKSRNQPAFTNATVLAGTYVTKVPEASVAQNAAVAAGQPEAANSCAPVPPVNTNYPNHVGGSAIPTAARVAPVV